LEGLANRACRSVPAVRGPTGVAQHDRPDDGDPDLRQCPDARAQRGPGGHHVVHQEHRPRRVLRRADVHRAGQVRRAGGRPQPHRVPGAPGEPQQRPGRGVLDPAAEPQDVVPAAGARRRGPGGRGHQRRTDGHEPAQHCREGRPQVPPVPFLVAEQRGAHRAAVAPRREHRGQAGQHDPVRRGQRRAAGAAPACPLGWRATAATGRGEQHVQEGAQTGSEIHAPHTGPTARRDRRFQASKGRAVHRIGHLWTGGTERVGAGQPG